MRENNAASASRRVEEVLREYRPIVDQLCGERGDGRIHSEREYCRAYLCRPRPCRLPMTFALALSTEFSLRKHKVTRDEMYSGSFTRPRGHSSAPRTPVKFESNLDRAIRVSPSAKQERVYSAAGTARVVGRPEKAPAAPGAAVTRTTRRSDHSVGKTATLAIQIEFDN